MSPRQTVVDNKKVCTKCHEWKALEDFVEDPRCTSGKTSRCKSCIYLTNRIRYHTNPVFKAHNKQLSRKSALKIRYGLTPEDVQNLLTKQNNRCSICNVPLDEQKPSTRMHIDHCHKTGKVRGVLCTLCNVGLGSFRDTVEFLYAAIGYIKDSR